MKKITKLKMLTACMLLAQHSYALEQLSDSTLSSVTGQDGITITHEVSKITIDQANWVDFSDNSSMRLGLHSVEVKGVNNSNIKSQIDLDVAGTTNGAGIRLETTISPFEATIQNVMLCTVCTVGATGADRQSLGSLMLATSTPLSFYLETTKGLFDKNSLSHLNFQLQNASITHKLNDQQLTLKDFNFNFAADGYMYIDPKEGIVLTTKNGNSDHVINLGRVSDTTAVHASRTGDDATNPGVNIDLRYGTEQKNIIRMGASGSLANGKIFVNSDQTGISNFNVTDANGVAVTAKGYEKANTGIHTGLSAEFTKDGNSLIKAGEKATTLELGGTGNGNYAIEFSNLSPLNIRTSNDPSVLNTQNAYLDLGDVYLNTMQATSLEFVISKKLQNVLGAASQNLTNYMNATKTSQNFALISIRGMDFQAIARKARFISDNSMAKNDTVQGSWGLGLPIYNLNANLGLFQQSYTYKTGNQTEIKNGLGFSLTMSTDGYGIDKKTNAPSTTSVLLIDGGDGSHNKISGTGKEEVNYYAGLRNIDAYLQTNGVIGYEKDGIYVKASNLLLAAKAEIAIGQLPGSLYNCVGTTTCEKKVVPIDNFGRPDDVLSSIAFKLDGNGELFIIPGVDATVANPDSNFLTVKASFNFNELTKEQKANEAEKGSYLSIINDDYTKSGDVSTLKSSSSVNLNKIQGNLALESRIRMKKDTVSMDSQVNFNPTNSIATPFRAEMAISPMGGMQKVADIAITGGVMRSNFGITPR
ncbi:DUF6160 family protein [Acinetobacter sp. WCHAc010052]|uniref:DUF6160 family protein n=1 Tax=Acinetobacter sp. WCHAc010052 TaxID=2004647 RepID=UPI000B3D2EAB|nr:DUF6160 family protein [Acinetobacter sp. WCHAc010052]AXY60826.1 hypothetical protein CDG61_12865 [Acinetobacter sp. WCHAc010052]